MLFDFLVWLCRKLRLETRLAGLALRRVHDAVISLLERSTGQASADFRPYTIVTVDYVESISIGLKRRLNLCAPLFRLPSEVLCEIAAALASIWPPLSCPAQRFPRMRTPPSLVWITLSYVCDILRQVLLGHHALWTYTVKYFRGEAQRECLSHAGLSPIALELIELEIAFADHLSIEDNLRFTTENFPRAREVRTMRSSRTAYAQDLHPPLVLGSRPACP
jgi:hypothetical protein